MSFILRRISELVVVLNHSDCCVYCPPAWRGGNVSPSPPFHILSCWFVMSAILRRISEVEVQNNFILYLVWQINKMEYERGERHEHWILSYLEMYSTQYTSPVQKKKKLPLPGRYSIHTLWFDGISPGCTLLEWQTVKNINRYNVDSGNKTFWPKTFYAFILLSMFILCATS